MLGRFLEISLHTPRIRESLAFYEALGFVQATVGETWSHPYAVVTDGRLFLGLHGAPVRSPALTFVLPELRQGLERLRLLDMEPEEQHLGDDVFNHAIFSDPNGQPINVIEARTFSPPQIDTPVLSTCGYFVELGIPSRNAEAARAFWERLGFVAMEEELLPFQRTALTSDYLDLALYRSRALRHPVLTFEDADMRERLATLRERGLTLSDEMPESLDDATNAVLIAPEGTRLLLMQSES
jgi:catechol 2,3-dioxygenase-like lactoylglutathione lyase family enzyme